jgi:hypothetical protein
MAVLVMTKVRKKIKNGEYYTLISAMVFLRVAFYLLTSALTGEFFLMTFYDLGVADFLLIALLTVIIICYHFKGRERLLRALSVSLTAAFVVILPRLFMVFFYTRDVDISTTLYVSILRIIEPLLVYIIPVGIIVALVFTIKPDGIGAYLKNSLLKPKSVVFLFFGFALIGVYIFSVLWWENAYSELILSPRATAQEAYDLIRIREYINSSLYVLNSIWICGTAICFYSGARIVGRGVSDAPTEGEPT